MSDLSTAIAVKEKRRKKTMKEAIANNDFYHIDKLYQTGAKYFVCYGQRSAGKTYSTLEHCLYTYKNSKRTFVYCRRWAEDIVVKNMSKLFDSLPVEKIFGKGYSIKFFRGAFILHLDDKYQPEDDDPIMDETIGWAICLNSAHHVKSQTFANCKIFVLDEFLQLKGESRLPAEYDNFRHNLSSTLRLAEDAEIFLLGNTISRYSVYFHKLGIDVKKLKQGEIKVFETPNDLGEPIKVAVEWCEYKEAIGQVTASYLLGSPMSVRGEWEIPPTSEIPSCDNEIAHERLVCSLFDYQQSLNLGIFLRNSTWYENENIGGIIAKTPHQRQFLVIRETNRVSSYYHCTTVKDLKYNTYSNLNLMLKTIKEQTGIDIENELNMGRVYAEDMFVADSFTNVWVLYLRNIGLKDLL